MKGSRQVLVKLVLFQLRERGHPQDDAMPNFFADSKCPIWGLSNEVSFVPEIFGKMVEIKETSFLSTREDTNFLSPLYHLVTTACY